MTNFNGKIKVLRETVRKEVTMYRLSRFCSHCTLIAVLWFLPATELVATNYTLTTQTSGSGMVTLNPKNGVYPANSVVTATAVPDGGWYFLRWTGDVSGTTNPLNVLMTSNIVITANFRPLPTFVINTSTNGMGSISLNPPSGSYLSNSVVTATALPGAGWVFANWEGYTNGNANPIEITVNSNEALTALFAQPAMIEDGPHDVTTAIGRTVNFSVQAIGTPTLYYQWWFNNSRLNNATNTALTLENVQLTQAGTYAITVSNAYGASSNTAMLTITNAPSGTNEVGVATQAALQSAMDAGGVVTFGFNGTITLTNAIDITNDVALDARNRTVVISGSNAVRLFNVSAGVTFSATNLVMVNGSDVGQNGTNSGFEPAQNGFPGAGGAIYDDGGTVQLSGCTLASNSVEGGTGGVAGSVPYNGVGGDGQGGAIFVNGGSLLLDSVNLWNNSAAGGPAIYMVGPSIMGGNGLGGAIYITNGTVLILNCNVSSNVCSTPAGDTGTAAFGGALFLASGSLALSNSVFCLNSAIGGSRPDFNESNRPGATYGGAIAAASGTATITFCQINSNVAQGGEAFRYSGTGEAQGGGIFSSATVLVSNSTFSGNQALSGSGSSVNTDGRGGAFYNSGSAAIVGCTFSSNIAVGGSAGAFGTPDVNYPGGNGMGGGICNISQLTMTNCTLALNSAQGGAGGFTQGVPGSGLGGGVCNSNGMFSAVNVTIASNAVAAGQGYLYQGVAAGANVANLAGTLSLKNSILAYPGTNGNASGTISDAGYNMSSDGSAGLNSGSSFNFTDPQLRTLGYYGGPTFTMALSSTSPAVDTGTTVGAPATDQRGLPRPSGPGTDMGAYELQQNESGIPALTFARAQQFLQLSFQGQSNASYFLQRSMTLTNWTEMELIGPLTNNAQVNLTIDDDGQSNGFFRLFLP